MFRQMTKEKEVCFVYSHEFNGEFYVKVEDFKEVIERLISIREENRKLKEINESQNEEIQRFKDNAMQDMREITELEIENKKLKEIIKDHILYEEKLEHRIIEFEELLHWE